MAIEAREGAIHRGGAGGRGRSWPSLRGGGARLEFAPWRLSFRAGRCRGPARRAWPVSGRFRAGRVHPPRHRAGGVGGETSAGAGAEPAIIGRFRGEAELGRAASALVRVRAAILAGRFRGAGPGPQARSRLARSGCRSCSTGPGPGPSSRLATGPETARHWPSPRGG